jgi:hypothetical protein
MSILDRFVRSKDQGLLLELADYLSECCDEPIDPAKAVAAARLLSTMINKRKAHSAWICLWRLSDPDANAKAHLFLCILEGLPERRFILERCCTCISPLYPLEQRITCTKFLEAFMCDNTRAQRMVSNTEGLLSGIIMLVHDVIADKRPTSEFGRERAHAIITLACVSMAQQSVDDEDEAIGDEYAAKFIEAGGLRALTEAFISCAQCAADLAKPDNYRDSYDYCFAGLSWIWPFLKCPSVLSMPKEHPTMYTFSREESLQFAGTLLDLLTELSDSGNTDLVHATAWEFLDLIRLQSGDELLTACFNVGPDRRNREPNLFVAFHHSLERHDDRTMTSISYRAMSDWKFCKNYPLFAELYSANFTNVDALVKRGGMHVATDNGGTAPNAASSAVAVEGLSGLDGATGEKPEKNRHCAYPDCAITGTGIEYTWKCARCEAVYYCSKDHQTEHWWAAHRAVCKRV